MALNGPAVTVKVMARSEVTTTDEPVSHRVDRIRVGWKVLASSSAPTCRAGSGNTE